MFLSELVEKKQSLTPVEKPVFNKEFDVIVCGLGTAGSLAALFLAQNGLSVLGVEQLTMVGGTHTAGGITGHYFGNPGGRYEEIDKEVMQFQQRHTVSTTDSRKLLVEKALIEHNAEIIYEATVCGVYLENNTVVGVKILTDAGTLSYRAKIVMDCTGDAYVAAIAGCPTQYGRASDGQMQPYSIVSLTYDGKHYTHTNIDFGRVNQMDEFDFSKALTFSRNYKIKEVGQEIEFIAQMPMLGIREGRRIIAEEMVTIKDVLEDRQTDSPMFYSYADLDKHGWDIAFDGEALGDWAVGANLGAYNVTVAVPYRAILPLGFEGILVPCRALGVDRDVSSCVRMNPDMKKVAEAASVWATLAVRQQKKLREVSYNEIKKLLSESGCFKESDNRGCCKDGSRDWNGLPLTPAKVSWITDPDDFEEILKTEKPGIAIWSAKRMGERALPVLQNLLNSVSNNTRKHSAFALAALGDSSGIPILREMVLHRDSLMLKDGRKNNNLRGCMAIYWLGRLADREITNELIALICNENEIKKEVYHQSLLTTRYKVADFEAIYYQFVSHSVMALIRIGDAYPDLRKQIQKAFYDAFSDGDYYYRITKRPKDSSEGNMVISLKEIAFSSVGNWNLKK